MSNSSKHPQTPSFLNWKAFILFLLVLTFILEVISDYFQFDLFLFCLNHKTPTIYILTAALAVITWDVRRTLKAEDARAKEKAAENGAPCPEDKHSENVFQQAWKTLKYLYWIFKRCGIACLLVIVLMGFGIPTTAAHFQVEGRAINIISNVINSVRYKGPESDPVVDGNTQDGSDDSKTPSDIPKTDTNAEDPKFLAEPERLFELSDEELDKLYYKSGPYAIHDWTDTNAIAGVLTRQITDLRAQQRPNEFDTKASVAMQQDAIRANNIEDTLSTSEELDDVINIRKSLQSIYPKSAFAKLLAANQQRYALEYVNAGGDFKTIEYYYGYSIYWDLERLCFADVDNYDVKNILSSISMRYHDIADASENGSQTQQYASVLSNAFKILENYGTWE